MASAIKIGSCAPAMPVFIRTASAPNSMAMAASEAVPTPASTISGTPVIDFPQDANIGLILDAEAAADGGAERHDGGGAGVEQALGEDDVVGGVGKDREAFLDQNAGGFERGLHIGIERGLVADDFELDPVGKADFAGQARGTDGFIGGVAAGRVGQQEILLRVDVVEQGFLAAIEIDAAHGDGDHVCAAGFERARGFLKRLVLARADDEAGAERRPAMINGSDMSLL